MVRGLDLFRNRFREFEGASSSSAEPLATNGLLSTEQTFEPPRILTSSSLSKWSISSRPSGTSLPR